jgi:tetratricopeptide (TPR) repeat protein
VLRFAIQFCDGMIHALSRGIKAHRDIKPDNCLVTEDRTLKVTDFGLAKVFDEASLGGGNQERSREEERLGGLGIVVSRTGDAKGTPHYMAPEQFEDAKHVDVRADVYSFGVMLFEMLTGQLLVRERGRSWKEWELLHKATPAPVLAGGLSAVNAVLQGCLAKAPEHRFADFGAVRERLAQIYEKLTGQAAARPATGIELQVADLNNKGVCLLRLERPEEALVCYDRALQLNSRDEWTWVNKGATLADLARPNEALACHDRALELNPRFEMAWYNKGNALRELARPEESLACYDRALEINPRLEMVLNHKGLVLEKLGRLDEALACYDRSLELNPHNQKVWNNKGVVLDKLGRPGEALAYFDRVLELNPRDQNAWNNKGYMLSALGRQDEALACYDRALELNPRDETAWNNKGTVLNKLGRQDEALACYNRAVELKPDDEVAWRNKGNLSLARFDQFLELNPRHQKAWKNKGYMLYELGRQDEALACYDRALELNPRDEMAWVWRGMALADLARLEEALTALEEGRKLIAAGASGAQLEETLGATEQAQRHRHPQAARAIQIFRQAMSGSGALKQPIAGEGTETKEESSGLLGRFFGKRKNS